MSDQDKLPERSLFQKTGDVVGSIVFDAPAAVIGVVGRYIGGADRKAHNVAVHTAAQAQHKVEKLERELAKAELDLKARKAAAAAWKANNRPTTVVEVNDVPVTAEVPARPSRVRRPQQSPTPTAEGS